MLERRSLSWPIVLGVIMILLLVALTIGWVLLTAFGARENADWQPVYLALLVVGTAFLVIVLVGVVLYLSLSVKAINLTRRQSNFVDSVTHELKSPIASLKLYLQTLTRHPVSGEQQEAFYRVMLDDVERLDDLINHLLDAGHMERRAGPDEVEDLPLAEVIRNCAEVVQMRYRIPREVIRLDLHPCIVRARQVDLDLIFRNLLDNAVKYADDNDPRVEVQLRAEEPHGVTVLICDNGRGIPTSQRRRIFRRFVRLGVELERDKPGTGLGLYIVRTLVSRLRGRVRVCDPGDERGTVFEVQLRGEAMADPASSDEGAIPDEGASSDEGTEQTAATETA